MRPGQRVVGHPVNVAAGIVFSIHPDVSVPGKVELGWERRYSTALLDSAPGPLGPGWTSPYFATLTRADGAYRFVTPEGDVELFADPDGTVERGEIVRSFGTSQEIAKRDGLYVITRWGVDAADIERYCFIQGRPGDVLPLASIEDVTGQGLDMLYDKAGRLGGIRQRLERRALVIAYTPESRIDSVSLASSGKPVMSCVRYEYDKAGRLIAAYDAMQFADRYEYDSASRMTREILKDGGVFTFKYDDKRRCVRASGLDRYDEKTFRYRDALQWTEVTDSLGYVTRYHWNANGQVLRETDPLGATKRTEYDEHGRIVATITPSGAATRFLFDEQGNRSGVMDPTGRRVIMTYNDAHLLVTLTDPAGGVWKRAYDASNRLTAITDPIGGVWQFAYDRHGNLARMTDPRGTFLRYVYSETGALLEKTDWEGNRSQFATDELGRLVEWIDPLGAAMSFHYDALGHVVRVDLADGSHLSCTYDAGGNPIAFTDGNGHTKTYRYGTCGRIFEKINAMGEVIRYRWGTEPNRLEHIINEKGEVCQIVHNAAGRVTSQKGFDGAEINVIYDKFGDCLATVNALGERTEYERNGAGQLTKRVLPDGTTSTFVYDALGNLISAVNLFAEVTFERDVLGNVVKESRGRYLVTRRYDAIGNLVETGTNLGFHVAYQIDRNGSVARLEAQDRFRLEFQRNARGDEIGRVLPGGLRLDQRYDSVGRLIEQQLGRGRRDDTAALRATTGGAPDMRAGALLLRRSYEYDAAGSLISLKDGQWGDIKYVYDPEKRLLQTLRASGISEHFGYDGAGNLTEVGRGGNPGEALEYGPGGRLARCGRTRFVHDQAGRLVEKIEEADGPSPRTWRFSWDGADQLTSVTTPDGAVWTYTYDALGRRIAKQGPGKKTEFVWDGDVVIHQVESGALEATWLFDPASFEPLFTLQRDSMFSVIPDRLGTPLELVDVQGNIAWSARLQSWGAMDRQLVGKVECPIRFPGQWFDEETGLHYSRFRYYDPRVGRFLSCDPIGLEGGLNTYAYAPNPINWIDPFGLAKKKGGGDCGGELSDEEKKKIEDQMKKAELPQSGSTPFKPKVTRSGKGGKAQIEKAEITEGPRAGKIGYVDEEGRIWIKNAAHSGYPEHWDVQTDGGKSYQNIGVDGEPNRKGPKPAWAGPQPPPPPPSPGEGAPGGEGGFADPGGTPKPPQGPGEGGAGGEGGFA